MLVLNTNQIRTMEVWEWRIVSLDTGRVFEIPELFTTLLICVQVESYTKKAFSIQKLYPAVIVMESSLVGRERKALVEIILIPTDPEKDS